MNTAVREVWSHNMLEEVEAIAQVRRSLPYVFLDTEFPGFIHSVHRGASEEEIYGAVKLNVDSLKLVQLGITLSDIDGRSLRSWQFNLSDFDPNEDECSKTSVEFLKRSGVDFDKNHRDGVSAARLSPLLSQSLIQCHPGTSTKWVTFHGLYDVAYTVKLLCREPLPSTLDAFLGLVWELLGPVYDLKHMASTCSGSDGCFTDVGLVRLSRMLGIDWDGSSHQGGHDSLLTAMVFWEMKRRFPGFNDDGDTNAGLLYSVEQHALNAKMENYTMVLPYDVDDDDEDEDEDQEMLYDDDDDEDEDQDSDPDCYYSYYPVSVSVPVRGYHPSVSECGYWFVPAPLPFYVQVLY